MGGHGAPRSGQAGADESFNGKFRDECLSMEWFRSHTDAKVMIVQWRHEYNEVRPHSSLAFRTTIEFKSQWLLSIQAGAILQE